MNEFIKAFSRFISRDLILLIGGGWVVGAFLYLFDRVPAANDFWILFSLLAGVGYFVAYALQDVICLTGITTTTQVNNPNRFVLWMYKRYMHEDWLTTEVKESLQPTCERRRPDFERIVMFQLIGTAGGPCMAVCGILLITRWLWCGETFDLFMALAAMTLSLVLICLSWLKGAQRAQFNAGG